MSNGYAVVDVETTGLSPGHHHRVIEVAVVHVDASGRRTDEWCTLVNPGRDLGAQHVHGISASDARRAPGFAEFARLGHSFPASGLCTMQLSRFLGASSRSLTAHSALQNARASASLLVRCLDRVSGVPPVQLDVPRASAFAVVDRRISAEELFDVAGALGLGVPEVDELHRGYLRALPEAAGELIGGRA